MIVHTADAGRSWSEQLIAATYSCAVGVNGVAVTTDGGERWRMTHFEARRNYRRNNTEFLKTEVFDIAS